MAWSYNARNDMLEIQELNEMTLQILEDLKALLHELDPEAESPTEGTIEEMLKNQSCILMVARDDAKVVGMATLEIVPKVGKRVAYLEDVVVSEEYRGQGLGKRLVSKLIEKAKECEVESISLTSRPHRVAAHALYESLGFVKRDTNVFKLTLP